MANKNRTKHYLFITYGVQNENNAVHNICMSLAEYFAEQGDRVTVLGHSLFSAALTEEYAGTIRTLRFYYPSLRKTQRIWEAYKKNRSKPRMLRSLIMHPYSAAAFLYRALTGSNASVRRYSREISSACRKTQYDVVISFSAPYHTAAALAKADTNGAKKLIYMADPYATHHVMGGTAATRVEKYVLERVDAVLVAPGIYQNYYGHPLEPFMPKMVPHPFPCLNTKKTVPYVGFSETQINCLFTGSFYEDIRPPSVMFSLLEAVNDDAIRFTVMGGFFESLSVSERGCLQPLIDAGRLTVLGSQPPEVAYGAMAAADILLNIGNTNIDMLPSKLLDYISTGKPIVNLCLAQQCPSVDILQRYSLHLNVFIYKEGKVSVEQGVDISCFCCQSKGKTVPIEEVYLNYDDYTPACFYRTVKFLVDES